MNPHLPPMVHTRGPWVYGPNKQQDNPKKGFIVLQEKRHDSANIATTIEMIGMTKQEAEANAKLIAAAPDLLEALLTFVDRQERGWHINIAWNNDSKKLIENAIKKAIL